MKYTQKGTSSVVLILVVILFVVGFFLYSTNIIKFKDTRRENVERDRTAEDTLPNDFQIQDSESDDSNCTLNQEGFCKYILDGVAFEYPLDWNLSTDSSYFTGFSFDFDLDVHTPAEFSFRKIPTNFESDSLEATVAAYGEKNTSGGGQQVSISIFVIDENTTTQISNIEGIETIAIQDPDYPEVTHYAFSIPNSSQVWIFTIFDEDIYNTNYAEIWTIIRSMKQV